MRELAPDDRTWRLEDLEAFERSYVRQLDELGAKAILERLEGIGGGTPIALLCWERPHEEFCHRWTLARYLREEAGIEVRELEAGMLRKRPDAAELQLFE